MSSVAHSVIAELVFAQFLPLNFARLVAELDTVMSRLSMVERQLSWDCEDVAIFDVPGTRIVLAATESPCVGVASSLSLSVGPSHLAQLDDFSLPDHAALCQRLVDRISDRFEPSAIFWHRCEGAVTADLIDALTDALPDMPDLGDDVQKVKVTVRAAGIPLAAPNKAAANDRPDLPKPSDPDLARLRRALYHEDDVQPYAQVYLAASTLHATLEMVWMPHDKAIVSYETRVKHG